MRIAQVAPLYESVPPKFYGGTERVVSWLTEELVRQGHEVTLFASGDSKTEAQLVPACEVSLRLKPGVCDSLAYHVLQLEKVIQRVREFDVIHFHTDYLHFPLSRHLDLLHVTTLHGRLDLPDLRPLYAEFQDMPVISISTAQRAPLPEASWIGTVHHGLPERMLRFRPEPEGYLAFLGRISPEKRADRAIEIAVAAGMKIKIAAKIDAVDRAYFESIRHLFSHPLVEFIGEIGDSSKAEFLGGAAALLFPIDWPEPFGLAMIEALACGTPVIAFNHGSVPEIIDHQRNGFVVRSIGEAVDAVKRIPELSRHHCREDFERKFSVSRMAQDYVHIYERLTGAWGAETSRALESRRSA